MVNKQKQRKRRVPKAKPALTLKVSGASIKSGRIPIPELLVICQHAQSAVNRQAEALEGRPTLRPGPKLGKVRLECTLELVSLGPGSALLAFDKARPQANLPAMANLSDDAIAMVGEAIGALGSRKAVDIDIDPGVLDSIKSMGELFRNGVTSIQWIVPARPGRRRIAAKFDQRVQTRVIQRLQPPKSEVVVNAGSFFTGWTFDQLVRMQAIEPLKDAKALAGGWPDDEDLDEVLDDIYGQRH